MRIDRLKAVRTEMFRLDMRMRKLNEAMKIQGNNSFHDCPRETGAILRASLDLTRALADLRKPGVGMKPGIFLGVILLCSVLFSLFLAHCCTWAVIWIGDWFWSVVETCSHQF